MLIGLAIVANSISIGFETNQRADLSRSFDDYADPLMEPWHSINMTFLLIFTLEVGKFDRWRNWNDGGNHRVVSVGSP